MTGSAVSLNSADLPILQAKSSQGLCWAEGHWYFRNFLPAERAWNLFETLKTELRWQQKAIRVFGKAVMQPRLMCWQGDRAARYSYSGLKLNPEPWHPELDCLRRHLQEAIGLPFNSVLANAYRNGQDSMGWHSDDELELGPEPNIASISLGAERVFRIRRKGAHQSQGMTLHQGSMLLMTGCSQARYQHALPKSASIKDWRINLTFRQILQDTN